MTIDIKGMHDHLKHFAEGGSKAGQEVYVYTTDADYQGTVEFLGQSVVHIRELKEEYVSHCCVSIASITGVEHRVQRRGA